MANAAGSLEFEALQETDTAARCTTRTWRSRRARGSAVQAETISATESTQQASEVCSDGSGLQAEGKDRSTNAAEVEVRYLRLARAICRLEAEGKPTTFKALDDLLDAGPVIEGGERLSAKRLASRRTDLFEVSLKEGVMLVVCRQPLLDILTAADREESHNLEQLDKAGDHGATWQTAETERATDTAAAASAADPSMPLEAGSQSSDETKPKGKGKGNGAEDEAQHLCLAKAIIQLGKGKPVPCKAVEDILNRGKGSGKGGLKGARMKVMKLARSRPDLFNVQKEEQVWMVACRQSPADVDSVPLSFEGLSLEDDDEAGDRWWESRTIPCSERDASAAVSATATRMMNIAPLQETLPRRNEGRHNLRDKLQEDIARAEEQLQVRQAASEEASADDMISVLSEYARMYGRQQWQRTPALQRQESTSDADRLEKAFQADIKKWGFLTADCVLAEISGICKLRKWSQGKLMNAAGGVGDLLKGLMKLLFALETTLHVIFSNQPIITIHDLEQVVLQTSAFKPYKAFKECNLGELHCHPEVAKRCGLRRADLPEWRPASGFPHPMTTARLLQLLYQRSCQQNLDALFDPEGWKIEEAINAIAEEEGLRDYRDLGVYVQRDWVLKVGFRTMRMRLERNRQHETAAAKAVDAVLPQLEDASGCMCDWKAWQKTMEEFIRLDHPGEALKFSRGLVPSLLGAKGPGLQGESAENENGTSFARTVLAPLLCASLFVAKSVALQEQESNGKGSGKKKRRQQLDRQQQDHCLRLEAFARQVAALQDIMPSEQDTKEGVAGVIGMIKMQLQAYPQQESSFANVLLRAERAFISGCGLTQASQLPLSLPMLLTADASLSKTLDEALQSSSTCRGEQTTAIRKRTADETAVAETLANLVARDLTARKARSAEGHVITLQELLECIGQGEAALCYQHRLGAGDFEKLGLVERTYGAFIKHNSERLLAHLSQHHNIAGTSAASLRGTAFCRRVLKAIGARIYASQEEGEDTPCITASGKKAELKSRVAAHFGDVLSAAELDVAAATALAEEPALAAAEEEGARQASGVPELQAMIARVSPLGGAEQHQQSVVPDAARRAAYSRAVDALRRVPPLMDIADAMPEWDTDFAPYLGSLSEFLQIQASSSPFLCTEVRAGVFMRLLAGKSDELMEALEKRDARQAAGAVLPRLLKDGVQAPVQHFEDLLGAAYERWAEETLVAAGSGGSEEEPDATIECFVLEAVALVPREARQLVGPVFAQPFIRLRRPAKILNLAAQQSPGRVVVARWLGYRFGVLEWQHLPWPDGSTTFMVGLGQPPACRPPLGNAKETHQRSSSAEEGALTIVQQPAESVAADAVSSDRDAKSIQTVAQDIAAALVPTKIGEQNLALCSDIARLKGVSLADISENREWRRNEADGSISEATRSLQRTVQGAVKRLAAELYSTETHFLLELLQNVDDCSFSPDVQPTLRLTVETDMSCFPDLTTFANPANICAMLALDYNETGFEEKHVRALCDIASSTKAQEQRKFIGAKGIGFKSVFRVTATPIVHSGPFSFHFDAHALDGLGYLLPFPLPGLQQQAGTRLVMPLHDQKTYKDVRTHIEEEVPPTLLLFLRNLRSIDVAIRDGSGARSHKSMFMEVDNNIATLSTQTVKMLQDGSEKDKTSQEQHWLVHKYQLPSHCTSAEATGAGAQELQLAFRIGDPGRATHPGKDETAIRPAAATMQAPETAMEKPSQQQAFAWLPLRSYGFRFIVQADWIVPSSREAITETAPSNQAVREELAMAFRQAAEAMVAWAIVASMAPIEQNLGSLIGMELGGAQYSAEADDDAYEEAVEDGSAVGCCATTVGSVPDQADPDIETTTMPKLRLNLAHLYLAVPLPGETAEFFKKAPKAILEELKGARVLVVRRLHWSAAHGGNTATLTPARSVRYALATPSEAVRPTFPRDVPGLAWSTSVQESLEPLLNLAELHIEVGGLPDRLATELGVRCVDSGVAVECLAHLHMQQKLHSRSQQPPEEMTSIDEHKLTLLHRLLLLVASSPRHPIQQLRDLAILPTACGSFVAPSQSRIYDVVSELGAYVGGSCMLEPRFSAMAHPRVMSLLHDLGVVRADGVQFIEEVLVPAITTEDAPERDHLLSCTQAIMGILRTLDDQGKDKAVAAMRSGKPWILVESTATRKRSERLVRCGELGLSLHTETLPESLHAICQSQWICPSPEYTWYCRNGRNDVQWWTALWKELGAWPAFAVETVYETSESKVTYSSTELQMLLESLQAVPMEQRFTLGEALVKWLAPHGEFYAQYLTVHRESTEQTSSGSALRKMLLGHTFLPTIGPRLAQPDAAWLPPNLVKPSQLEEDCVIADSARAFVEGWPQLGIPRKPTLNMFVRILKGMQNSGKKYSVGSCTALYARLYEHWSDVAADEDVEYLRSGAWVFVPRHPHLVRGGYSMRREAFDHKGHLPERDGSFQSPQELVLQDPAWLFDTYRTHLSDEACAIARQASGIRVVGNYFWGLHTLFPQSMHPKLTSEQNKVHYLLEALGARRIPDWNDYIKVLKALPKRDRDWNAVLMLFTYVFSHLAGQVEVDQREDQSGFFSDEDEQNSQTANLNNNAAVNDGEEQMGQLGEAALDRLPNKARGSSTLLSFVRQVAATPCIPTVAGTWEPLGRVLFADPSQKDFEKWRKEALRLVCCKIPSNFEGERARRGLGLCGLSEKPILMRDVLTTEAHKLETESSCARLLLLATLLWVGHDLAGPATPVTTERWPELLGCLRKLVLEAEVLQAGPGGSKQAKLDMQEWVTIDAAYALPFDITPDAKAADNDDVVLESVQDAIRARNVMDHPTKVVMTRSRPVPCFVGLRPGRDHLHVMRAAKSEPLQHSGEMQSLVVENLVALAEGQNTVTDPHMVRRELSKRLQAITSKMPPMDDSTDLKQIAWLVEKAARDAGYDGQGDARALMSEEAAAGPKVSPEPARPRVSSSDEPAPNAKQQWMVAAAATTEDDDSSRPSRVPAVVEDNDPSSPVISGSLLATATAALAPRINNKTSAPPPSTFGGALPLGPQSQQEKQQKDGVAGTATGAMGPMLGDSSSQGPASNSTASFATRPQNAACSGAAVAGRREDRDDAASQVSVASSRGFFYAGMRWFGRSSKVSAAGGWSGSQPSKTASHPRLLLPPPIPPAELSMQDAAAEAAAGIEESSTPLLEHQRRSLEEAQARGAEDVHALNSIGVLGEEVAAQGFEEMGYDVAWVNRCGERGWPFDLALRDYRTFQGKDKVLAKLFRSAERVEQDSRQLEDLCGVRKEGEPPIILVEVKASLGEPQQTDWDPFHISSSEVALASKLGAGYWLARVHNLATERAKLTVFRNMAMALHQGRLHLLLLAK